MSVLLQRNSSSSRIPAKFGIFSKSSKTFIESGEFRESEKSLRHECGSVSGSVLLQVSLWDSGIISVSTLGVLGSNPDFLIFSH